MQKAREQYGPIADACVQQLTATGVDLSQYTTSASANDAVALVKALGYDDYNLYGISYGTRLALEVMRNHPESGLRSVVLDSTYPPEIKIYEQLSIASHEVAMQLFADLRARPGVQCRLPRSQGALHRSPGAAADGTGRLRRRHPHLRPRPDQRDA